MLCGAIVAADAAAQIAADPTRVGSCRGVAAGTLPNTPGKLEGSNGNSQRLWPGMKMPASASSARELPEFAAYVGSVK
jgi:hypothetical protein